MGIFMLNGRMYTGLINTHGTFIDTDNVITSGTYSSSLSYTAITDCYIVTQVAVASNGDGSCAIDGEDIASWHNGGSGATLYSASSYLKQGQVFTATGSANTTIDYTVYNIQMGSPVTFLSEYASQVYSNTEREVGCWLDGKPIYQRTFQITTPSTPSVIEQVQDVSSLNIDTVVNLFGHYKDTNINWGLNIYFNTGRSANVFINGAKTYISMLVNDNVALNKTAYVTALYTKTTDTAGSGSLVPSNMPAVHFDGNEKIIGTWFGETLYEKSIDIGALPDTAQKQVAHNITNLKNVVETSGYAVNSSGTTAPLPYVHPAGNEYTIAVTITATTVNINTGRDRTGFTGYVTLRYTKTV